jgi:hypothetical protein
MLTNTCLNVPTFGRSTAIRRSATADLPHQYWNPTARRHQLDTFGIDVAVILPQWALLWGAAHAGVGQFLEVCRPNMEAWNRWAVEAQQEGRGRLQAVGHLSLRGGDPAWLEDQLTVLARGGVRAAMISHGLVDGRRPSHPDHDGAWDAFVRHGVTPLFHSPTTFLAIADWRRAGWRPSTTRAFAPWTC